MITHFRVHSRHFREECVLFSLYAHSCVRIHTRIHTLGFKGAGGDSGHLSLLLSFCFPFQNY